MKDFYFVIGDHNNFELWVDGKCITNCFSLGEKEADLMKQLVHFAKVPCYAKIDFEEDYYFDD